MSSGVFHNGFESAAGPATRTGLRPSEDNQESKSQKKKRKKAQEGAEARACHEGSQRTHQVFNVVQQEDEHSLQARVEDADE